MRLLLRPVRPRLEQLVACEADQQDRHALDPAGQVLDQVQQRRLGPVDVVEDDDQRPLRGERLEQLPDGPEDLLRRSAAAEPDRGGDAVGDHSPRPAATRPAPQPLERLLVVECVVEPGGRLEDRPDRPVGDALAVRNAPSREGARAVRGRDELTHQPGLADPGGAEHGYELAALLRDGPLVRGDHEAELVLPPGERRVQPPLERLSATSARRRHASTGADLPFSSSGPAASTSTASRTRARVLSERGSRPAPPHCSSRAATLTASPLAKTSPPPTAATSPVLIPVRVSSRTPYPVSSSSLSVPSSARRSSAARTARSASSS